MGRKTQKAPTPDDMKHLQDTVYVISGKWKLPILHSLANGNRRFRELQRSIPGITAMMLTRELRDLELNGFIERNHPDPFTTITDYEVTYYCKSFETIIVQMIEWGKRHRAFITSPKGPAL